MGTYEFHLSSPQAVFKAGWLSVTSYISSIYCFRAICDLTAVKIPAPGTINRPFHKQEYVWVNASLGACSFVGTLYLCGCVGLFPPTTPASSWAHRQLLFGLCCRQIEFRAHTYRRYTLRREAQLQVSAPHTAHCTYREHASDTQNIQEIRRTYGWV